jgi:hypothetical protein
MHACGCARLAALPDLGALFAAVSDAPHSLQYRSHRTARMSVDERVALDVDVAIERFEATVDAMYKEISA